MFYSVILHLEEGSRLNAVSFNNGPTPSDVSWNKPLGLGTSLTLSFGFSLKFKLKPLREFIYSLFLYFSAFCFMDSTTRNVLF